MGVVRDLLSKNMRIKEILSNNKPVRWLLQYKGENGWETEATNGLIFYNYLGKKSERLNSNDTLPPRPLK